MSKELDSDQPATLDDVASLLRELIEEVHGLREALLGRSVTTGQLIPPEPVPLNSAAILSLRGKGLAVTIQKLNERRIASTEEIAADTQKERSQESANLNALVHLGHARKFRIGRLVFYSTLPQAELDRIAVLPRHLQELAVLLTRESSGVVNKEKTIEKLNQFGRKPRRGIIDLERMLEEISEAGYPIQKEFVLES